MSGERCFRKAPSPKVPLRNCPFCGDAFVEHEDHHGTWYAHSEAPGPCIISHMQLFDQSDYEQWNRRVEQPSEPGAGEWTEEPIKSASDIGWYYYWYQGKNGRRRVSVVFLSTSSCILNGDKRSVHPVRMPPPPAPAESEG